MFTSLHHLIDGDWMREAYRLTRKDGATGIDGVSAADYEKDLEANLESLLDRDQVGQLPRAAGAPALHPEGGRHETSSRHPDVRRQGGAAGDPDVAGADLRSRTFYRARTASGADGRRTMP